MADAAAGAAPGLSDAGAADPLAAAGAWIDSGALGLLEKGGPAIWAIAALSVVASAIALWKIGQFLILGAFGGRIAGRVLAAAEPLRRRGAETALIAQEIERAAKAALAELRLGLRGLEVIAGIAPLLGLLGTVLGMIAAFQALQSAGAQADPALLAGGIWEALLTTAAGMAVAIIASVALSWAESVVERNRLRIEDAAARLITGEAA